MAKLSMNQQRQLGAIAGAKQAGAKLHSLANLASTPSIFDVEKNIIPEEYVRKYEIYESKEDILVLSCTWYRLRHTSRDPNTTLYLDPPSITRLVDRQLFISVTEEDRTLANTIRDYYSKKIMMWKLKNTRMTPFRDDLNEFIHSDGKTFKDRNFGLVYRLPEFYFYDIKIDDIFRNRNNVVLSDHPGREMKTLRFVDSTKVDRKGFAKRNEYWFVDENNTPVNIILDRTNPLINIWEQLINAPLTLEGFYFPKQKDDREYYRLEKYNIVG